MKETQGLTLKDDIKAALPNKELYIEMYLNIVFTVL